MNRKEFSTPVPLKRIRITDPFWTKRLELVRQVVLPYQYEALNDRVDGAEKSYCLDNFRKAGRIASALKEGKAVPVYPVDKWVYDDDNADRNAFHGWVFQDSDAYKWLEAVGYSLINHPDPALEAKARDVIDLICAAQLENGYLDTLYIINDRGKCFTNLRDYHELYCFGHLAEAAVSFFNATGDRKLLDAALRFADLICRTFGEEKIKGYPGHEIAEMALVKLYDLTGEERYLAAAEFFINERGRKPYYFDTERGRETTRDDYFYHQAHCAPRHQHEAVGHAVRGVYLYSGMADVSKRRGDEELYDACRALWDNIENKKLYITGGIGATADGEAFSFDYDLPNDLAYSETCASIGLVFFARRMAEIYPDSRYGNVAERALYNTVPAGMAEDGKAFFYVNPLEVLPEACRKDSRKRHVKPVRQKWFSCACCPPNLARLFSSLGEYCFSENEDTLWIHQYVGAEVEAAHATLRITSSYALDGKVKLHIVPRKAIRLAVRIPEWSRDYTFSAPSEVKDGYAYFTTEKETEILLSFPMEVRLIKCSNRVRANIGKAAVTRGPFVYCMEEADNGADLQMLRLSREPAFRVDGDSITADGFREAPDTALYRPCQPPDETPCKIQFLPYYRWGNRGENEMSVYIRY